jgi:hypothetical protein
MLLVLITHLTHQPLFLFLVGDVINSEYISKHIIKIWELIGSTSNKGLLFSVNV